jgi:UDP-hydrolysing UDP-N-acetyl-D-glucosamine 2-epimerase
VEASTCGLDGPGVRRIAVLTTGRQDWGILRSTCLALERDPDFELSVLAGGMHCSKRFGETVRLVEDAGFAGVEKLKWIPDDHDSPPHVQIGAESVVLGEVLSRRPPEALLLVGDRFETMAAALVATVARVPLIHLHGGEETGGAFDDLLRHAISKLSHLHLVSHPEHKLRLGALGEDPLQVHVVGAPGLDNAHRTDLATPDELQHSLGVPLQPPIVLVTLQPSTLSDTGPAELASVIHAVETVSATYIICAPNTDPGHEEIRHEMAAISRVGRRVMVEALGDRRYWGLLKICDALLGNSSSALIEAPVFGVPAVNVGPRQEGRIRGPNVIDVPPDPLAVTAALRKALDPGFRGTLANISPYGDGRSAGRIVDVLRGWAPPRPPRKPPVRLS